MKESSERWWREQRRPGNEAWLYSKILAISATVFKGALNTRLITTTFTTSQPRMLRAQTPALPLSACRMMKVSPLHLGWKMGGNSTHLRGLWWGSGEWVQAGCLWRAWRASLGECSATWRLREAQRLPFLGGVVLEGKASMGGEIPTVLKDK